MFREMRKSKQALSNDACLEILSRATGGVLALSGDDGYPYAVPMSFVYADGVFYFHSAKQGHKIDAIKRCAKASFCVIDQDLVRPESYTTHFRSVIAFGSMEMLSDPQEIYRAIDALAKRYAPEDSPKNRAATIDREIMGMCMFRLTVEHMTGKEARELAQQRNA